MYLRAISYRTPQGVKVYKFENASKIQSFEGDQQTQKEFEGAVKYGLTGQPSPHVFSVTMQLIDDSSDQWLIERSPERSKFLHNNKPIANPDVFSSLLASALGDFEDIISNSFDLELDEGKLFLKDREYDRLTIRKTHELLKEVFQKSQTSVSKLGYKFSSIDDSISFGKKTEKLYYTIQEMNRQVKALESNAKSLGEVDPQIIFQIESEVKMLEAIKIEAESLLDPAFTPKILKEKYLNLCKKIEEKKKNLYIEKIPVSNLPWAKLAKVLSTKESYAALEKASLKTHGLFVDEIEPVYNAYLLELKSVLDHDLEITAELENCLSSLNMERINREKKTKSVSHAIANFIKPSAGNVPEDIHGLEKARMNVDYTLQKLGELHAELASVSPKFSKQSKKYLEKFNYISTEKKKLDTLWIRVAGEYKLPTSFTLSQLVKLMNEHVELVDLYTQAKNVKNKIEGQKIKLTTLQAKVLEWRKLSNSQKDTSIDTPPLLLAEVRTLLNALPKKIQHLEKIKFQSDKMKALVLMQQNAVTRQDQVIQKWSSILSESGFPDISHDDPMLPTLYELTKELQANQSIVKSCEYSAELSDSIRSEKMPLIFVYCDNIPASILASKSDSLCAEAGMRFLLTSDHELHNQFKRQGIAASQPVGHTQSQGKAVGQSPREVVDILNGRRV